MIKKNLRKTKKYNSKVKKYNKKKTLKKQIKKSNKLQKKKTKIGGKLIATGSFGCAYRPALKCKDSELRLENTVSKLISITDAEREINEMVEIHKIDPEYKFHLKGPTQCTIGEFDEEIDGKLENCKISKNTEDLIILNYEDGGMDLYDYIYNKKKFIEEEEDKMGSNIDFPLRINEFIASFYHMKSLVEGLQTMNKNSYGHNDIKLLNIVVKDNKFKYIDFGLASYYKDANKKVPFYNKYYVWSLETLLLKSWSLMSLEDNIEEDFTREILAENSYNYLLDNYEEATEDFKYTNPVLTMIEDEPLTNIIINQVKEKGLKEYKKEVIEKMDIYSLGIVYTELFHDLLYIKFPWTTNDELGIFKGYEEYIIIREIRDLIYRMTMPVACTRINADDLVKEYNKIIKLIEDTLF